MYVCVCIFNWQSLTKPKSLLSWGNILNWMPIKALQLIPEWHHAMLVFPIALCWDVKCSIWNHQNWHVYVDLTKWWSKVYIINVYLEHIQNSNLMYTFNVHVCIKYVQCIHWICLAYTFNTYFWHIYSVYIFEFIWIFIKYIHWICSEYIVNPVLGRHPWCMVKCLGMTGWPCKRV